MALRFRDRVMETTTTTGTGAYTVAGAVTGFQTLAAIGDGNTFYGSVWAVDSDGNPSGDWESGYYTYTASGTSVARTAILYSTNSNNAVNWGAGTKRIACEIPSLQANIAPQMVDGGLLSLATGIPIYTPQAATISSINTGTEVATFSAAHGWVTGTMVTPASTTAGLTVNTVYFINALSTTTCAFYTTLANAEADSSRVNLTADTSFVIRACGIQSTTLKYVPNTSDMIGLPSPNGLTWGQYSIGAGLSLAIGTLTAGAMYDAFVYLNSGTPTMVRGPAWATINSRGTGAGTSEIERLNGRWVNAENISGGPDANCGVLVGSFYTVSTTAIEDSGQPPLGVTPKRHLANVKTVRRPCRMIGLSSWTYNSATIRQAGGSAAYQAEVVSCLGEAEYNGRLTVLVSASGFTGIIGIGEDSTTVFHWDGQSSQATASAAQAVFGSASLARTPSIGWHKYTWLEKSFDTNTVTFYGDVNGAQYGLIGDWDC